MPKRPKAPELRVFKSGSVESRLPPGPSLRKQKSLTNLAFLTDAEKKMQLYEPRWSDDMAKAAKGSGRGGLKAKEAPLMSKSLSKSEHSLFQARLAPGLAKPPLAPLPSSLGKPSRIPRGPYAEVKPLSKAPEADGAEDSKSDDELLSSKAKGREKPQQQPAPAPGPAGKGQEERAYLKVDPELVVTVLGDLEQLLFSQMLGESHPESQRKRTVQNVLDLRQNLEETMSSLRGSQVSHSSLEMTCYDSDEANPRSVSSLSNRSSPVSWRYGQSSPRLQAGDAPSVGGSCRSEGTPSWYMHSERAHYSHTMPMRSPSKLSHISRLELVESLDTDDVDLKSGYMSDSDLMGKTLTEDDDITTGWDESSSISSGLSDASDNLSSEEFNASSSLNSLPSSPTASRRNSAIAVRAGHPTELGTGPRPLCPFSTAKGAGRADLERGSLGVQSQKGRRAGVRSSIACDLLHLALLPPGKPEAKADKSKLSVKNAGLQRSSSDAGRDRIGDAKKPPSGLARPSTSGSFGYKKPPPATGTATVMQAGGSATLGKIQKSSGIPVKPVSGRKTSLDVSNAGSLAFWPPGLAPTSSTGACRDRGQIQLHERRTGGRGGNRPVSSNIDPSLLSTKQGGISVSRLKEPSKIGTSRSTPAPVNQTDREKEKAKAKAVALDSECISLKSIGSPESTPKAQASHSPAAKWPSYPQRRSGRSQGSLPAPAPLPQAAAPQPEPGAPTKSYVKPPSLANLDKVNSNSLDLPSSSDLPQPHASKRQDPAPAAGHLTPCFAPSPAPILNINSASFSRSVGQPQAGIPHLAILASFESPVLPKLRLGPERDHVWHPPPPFRVPDSSGLRPLPTPRSLLLCSPGPGAFLTLPTSATTPRITRSNSIPTHDSAFELYSTSQMGSTLSLADRPKGMIRSGSFRDPADDVHGSVLSLASSASSTYSSQIRKLRRELESSQEKVATLTSQLSANVSLATAPARDYRVSSLCFCQDTELLDLRETIDFLKKKNSEAQAVIQGALNGTDITPKELRIKRQNSSDSISSLNSITSHSSIGSGKDADAKKKKKKSWVGQGAGGEEAQWEIVAGSGPGSGCPCCVLSAQGTPAEVSELRSELWEKEMKLTDIRLEALNSAHQLDQLRETMHNMQVRAPYLHGEPRTHCRVGLVHRPWAAPLACLFWPFPALSLVGQMARCSQAPPLVCSGYAHAFAFGFQDLKQQEFFLGCSKVSGKVDWKTLDEAVCQVFKVQTQSPLVLGPVLHGQSPVQVELGGGPIAKPLAGALTPPALPTGLKEKCVDSLVFETLLLKHRRLILSGPSGTGKTYLTNRLAEYLVERSGREVTEGIVNTFNMPTVVVQGEGLRPTAVPLQPGQSDRPGDGHRDVPLVILLDDLSEAGSISELVNGALTCKYHKCAELSLSPRMLTFSNNVEPANGFLVRYLRRKLLESDSDINANRMELLRVLDWVPKLWYHLHTFWRSTAPQTSSLVSPCFFLSCPIGIEDFRTWFIDLWNNSIIPYLQEGAKDGIKVSGRTAWEDPVEWVRDTLPWPSAQQDQSKLYHLPPPSVGPHTIASPPEERTVKDTTPSSLDSDPLMAMLLKLQEAANYIESPDRESLVDPNLQPTP
uniref:Neuron navigator 1 n=1 Tax=Gopherus evgoodei TaxID=1825980 RepID=A0A8C4YIA0_9SAUR